MNPFAVVMSNIVFNRIRIYLEGVIIFLNSVKHLIFKSYEACFHNMVVILSFYDMDRVIC